MAANAAMDDAQEGIEAFLQKRSPVWPTPVRGTDDPVAIPDPAAG